MAESGAVPPAFGFRVRARHFNYARLHLIPLGSCPNNRSHRSALRAGRLMLHEIQSRIHAGESFAFETTLAGRHYARLIPLWQRAGYHVRIIFLSLPTADLAVARVSARVAQGGHNVPEHVVRRRFDAGLKNFHETFCSMVNSWVLYDNSRPVPTLIAAGDNL
jgi:predicted ABC-type ATPase